VLVATSTPDNTFPATAVNIQNRLGMTQGYAFDLQAVCTGFVYAMATADLHIRGGMAKRVLVIGAETFSRILDWKDRTTCVLFGDGAGALVLEAAEGEGTIADRGVLTAQPAFRRLPQGQALRRWRPVAARARSGTCAWRAARSSNMRSA
jgi:3-oxoacyl-[acyl-carrier-protein] synthase-3